MVRAVILTADVFAANALAFWLKTFGHRVLAIVSPRFNPQKAAYRPEWADGPLVLVEHAPDSIDILFAGSPTHLHALLAPLAPDLVVTFGFPWRVPPDALAVPRLGAINVHPSLLPKYRGPNPLGWTFRNGDTLLGLTVHRMDATFDTGPILATATAPLTTQDDADNIAARLVPLLFDAMSRAMPRVLAGDIGEPQPPIAPNAGSRFTDDFLEVDWTLSAAQIHDQVRSWRFAVSVSGRAGALATIAGVRVRIIKSSVSGAGSAMPGAIVEQEATRTRVQCGDGSLWILQTLPVA